MKISIRKSKKLRRSKKYDGISSSQSSSGRRSSRTSGRRSSRTSGRRSSRSPTRITPTEAMQLAEQLSEFMKRNMAGDEDDENHINNKLMDIILPHKIYYGINYSNLEINSEGAHPDDKELKNLRYWTHAYRKYIDMPASNDDDAYSY